MTQENIFSLHQRKNAERTELTSNAEAEFLKNRAEKIITSFHDELDLFYAYMYSQGFPLAVEVEIDSKKYLSYALHKVSYGQDFDNNSGDYSITYSNDAVVLMIDEDGTIKFMRLNDEGGVFNHYNHPHKTGNPRYIPLRIPGISTDNKRDESKRTKQPESIPNNTYNHSAHAIDQDSYDILLLNLIAAMHTLTKRAENVIAGISTERMVGYSIRMADYTALTERMFPEGFTFQEHQANTQRNIAKQSLQNLT